MAAATESLDAIRHYYGEVLKSSADLQTSACCLAEAMPRHLVALLADIHPEVCERFCGRLPALVQTREAAAKAGCC